jgi:hypothetical protein
MLIFIRDKRFKGKNVVRPFQGRQSEANPPQADALRTGH